MPLDLDLDLDLSSLLDIGFCSRMSLGLGSRLLDSGHEGSSANGQVFDTLGRLRSLGG